MPPGTDYETVYRTLRLMHPRGVFNVRALPWESGSTLNGFFDDPKRAATAIYETEQRAQTVWSWYVTLNTCHDAAMSLAPNKLLAKEKIGANVAAIKCRAWWLFDFDPVRVSGTPASDSEKALALEAAEFFIAHFKQAFTGYPMIFADSGNGYHLLSNHPLLGQIADTVAGVQRTYWIKCVSAYSQVLRDQFHCDLDSSVGEMARISKIYGTIAYKGYEYAPQQRFHRRSTLLWTLP